MERLKTETALAGTIGIDTWDDGRILATLVEGQQRAVAAVSAASPLIAEAAAICVERLKQGGRLVYAGAGASIRLGVHDGSELPATFGMAEDRILYCIAGGRDAMFDTLAEAEDDAAAGANDAAICKPGDVMIAIAASGTTPYTIAAADVAKRNGAAVISIVNNAGSPLGALADVEILLDSGPEIITGSTRMGAGTAQKAALNLLSTLTHVRLGAVHDGMMVNVRADNAKLKGRAARIVIQITGATREAAVEALDQSAGHVKSAILICAGAKTHDAAQRALTDANGNLRLALQRLTAP